MRSEKTITTPILVVLLIYVFITGNISGELALCIGDNWHIALEPLSHEHYYNRTHIEQSKSSLPGHEHDEHLDNPHCKPCIDIPIFIGPTDNRLPLKPVKPNPETLISLREPALITDDQFVLPVIPHRFSSTMDENRFLQSIILLV